MRAVPFAIQTTALAPQAGAIVEAGLGDWHGYSLQGLGPLAAAMRSDAWVGKNHADLFADVLRAAEARQCVPDLDAALCDALARQPGAGPVTIVVKRIEWLRPWLSHLPRFSRAIRPMKIVCYGTLAEALTAFGFNVPQCANSLRAAEDCRRLGAAIHAVQGLVTSTLNS